MEKKIGMDMRILGTRHGGIGRYVAELFSRILAMDKQNRYFLFFNEKNVDPQDLEIFSKFANAELVATSARHYSLAEQSSFLRTLNKYNLDLVHFPNFNTPLLYKKPFVATIHDMVHHKIGGAKKSHLLHFLAYKKIIRSSAHRAEQIITVSEYSKKDIVSFLQQQPEKIKVIYEGSSLDKDISEAQVNSLKKHFLLDKPYFLFVGVMERKKNLVNLSRGFDVFLQKYNINMDLVIAGKVDPHYPEIKHKAQDIKHPSHLVFTDQVDDEDLACLYKGAYAFVSASLHEGFGLPGVEALGFGLPLLVSNISVFNEIYDNAAVYFNPLDPEDIAEKMYLLVRDNQFYSQIQEKSFNRSLLFDWQKAAQETLAVYQSCLDSSPEQLQIEI
jgi:glycosyltransferase involved in cell wall biosynthesis